MLAAVIGVDGADSIRARLEAIGRAAGFDSGQALITPGGGAMVWRGPSPTGIDAASGCAWIGTVRGALPGPTDLEFVAPPGDYAMVALRGSGLTLARSRFGGRSLYYARRDGWGVVVCSRLAPLVSALPHSPEIDRRRLAAVILTTTYFDFERTVYEGVNRVPSGEVLVVDIKRTRRLPPREMPAATEVRTAEEAAEEVRARLFRVLGRITEGAGRVAVLAGGGVDSSALLGTMIALSRGASRREVIALAMDFGGEGDDRPYLRALCESLGIVPIRLNPKEVVLGAMPIAVIDGAPFPWPTAEGEIGLLRAARRLNADVVLSGTFGDDVFGGDMRAFAALARSGHPLEGLLRATSLQGTWEPRASARSWSFFFRPVLVNACPAGLARPLRHLVRTRPPSWAGPVLRDVFEANRAWHTQDSPSEILSGGARRRRLAMATYHLDCADYRGQVAAHTGCVRVDAMLDEEIVDFVSALPARFLFHGGFHRGLLREAMRGLVPDRVRLRPDKASATKLLQGLFGAPARSEAIESFSSVRALGALGLVEPALFRRAFSTFWRTRDNPQQWMGLWPVLAAEIFARHILDGNAWPSERTELSSHQGSQLAS